MLDPRCIYGHLCPLMVLSIVASASPTKGTPPRLLAHACVNACASLLRIAENQSPSICRGVPFYYYCSHHGRSGSSSWSINTTTSYYCGAWTRIYGPCDIGS
ncbi:hypothetical protein V8C35DRAFT_287269 [Trichoderma chlorosporum]